MTRSTLVLGLAFIFLSTLPLAAQNGAAKESPPLVVLNFDFGLKKEGPEEELLADLVSAAVADDYPVVDRKNLPKILAEQKLTLRDLVNPDQALKVGKLSGAKLLLSGRVFRLGENTFVSARVISVETSRFKGLSITLPGEPGLDKIATRTGADLVKALPRLSEELLKPSDPQQPNPERPVPQETFFAPTTIAVLNFENLDQGNARWAWLGKGLADLTIGDLASQGLKVVSREQMQDSIKELALKEQNNRPNPQGVARVLKASRCVHGTFQVVDGKVEMQASIQAVDTGKLLHSAQVSGKEADVLSLQKKLSAELVDVIKGNKPGTVDPAKLPRWTESLAASELLYQGIDLFDKGQYLDAWGLFRRALRQDARYADALYWSGRMMYYVQEYHQARVDLERFTVEHPSHQRAGDAVMEIINSVQQTALHPEEVLQILGFAARLAPKAEVPNQFGAAYASTVALYTAGQVAPILNSQGRMRESFAFFREQLQTIPRGRPLYWIGWHTMFRMKIEHLKATGESLTMPPRPALDWIREEVGPDRFEAFDRRLRLETIAHPPGRSWQSRHYAGIIVVEDCPIRHDFHSFSPTKKVVDLDFTERPLVPYFEKDPDNRNLLPTTYTRHFAADSQHYLAALDVEVRYILDPNRKFIGALEGEGLRIEFPFGPSGKWTHRLNVPHNTRAFPLRVRMISPQDGKETTTAAIVGWKVTAELKPCEDYASTLIVRTPKDNVFNVMIDDLTPLLVKGQAVFEHLGKGPHTVVINPARHPRLEERHIIELGKGEVVEMDLSLKGEPNPFPNLLRGAEKSQISAPYDIYRLGPSLGDQAGLVNGDINFLEDRQGKWILIWNLRRDLYMAISSDKGVTWSRTVKLPLPVNSAHTERFPSLMQDNQGRYVLTFTSDRNLARGQAVYVCWSEDLISFSAPVLISMEANRPIRLVQRPDGAYLAYVFIRDKQLALNELPGGIWSSPFGVCASQDLLTWAPPEMITGLKEPIRTADVLEFEGNYLALLSPFNPFKATPDEVQALSSKDGIHFSPPEHIPCTLTPREIVCRSNNGRAVAICSTGVGECALLNYERGKWSQTTKIDSFHQEQFEISNGTNTFHGEVQYFFGYDNWMQSYYADGIDTSNTSLRIHMVRRPNRKLIFVARELHHLCHPTQLNVRIVRKSEITALLEQLQDSNREARYRAACSLASLGREQDSITPRLIDALKSDQAAHRIRAASAFAVLDDPGANAVLALIDALKDREAGVRYYAAVALARANRETETILPILIEALEKSNEDVRSRAISALAKLGAVAQPASSHLLAGLHDKNSDLRFKTLVALANISLDKKTLLPILALALKDDTMPIRFNAVVALRDLGNDAIPFLLEALKDKEMPVRTGAAFCLGTMGPVARRAIPALIAAADQFPEDWFGYNLVDSIDQLGGGQVIPALVKILKTKNKGARWMAIYVLGRLGGPDAISGLIESLKDPDHELRSSSASILGSLGPAASAAVPALKEAIAKDAPGRAAYEDALRKIQGNKK